MTDCRKKAKYNDLIASYLWGELSSDEERKLLECKENDSRFSRELQMHQRVDELLGMAFKADANIKKPSSYPVENDMQKMNSKSSKRGNIRNISFPSRDISHAIWKKLSIAAVVLFSIGGIWFNYSNNLTDQYRTISNRTFFSPEINHSPFLVLYAFGSVAVDAKAVKTGDIIDDFQSLHVGEDSFCDLQIHSKNMTAVLRLYPNTDYSNRIIKAEGVKKYYTAIDQGRALFRVDKLNTNDQFEVFMPNFSAKVVGTQFYMETGKDGNLAVGVVEGKVRIDLHLEKAVKRIANNPDEFEAIHKVLAKTYNLERILSAGQLISAEQTILEQRINQIRLGVKNKNAKMAPLFSQKGTVDQKLQDLKSELAELKSIDEINVVKKSSELSAILNKRNSAMEELFFRRIEVILNKRVETLFLKSGGTIRGIILQMGDQYQVHTPFSVKTVDAADVKEIKF